MWAAIVMITYDKELARTQGTQHVAPLETPVMYEKRKKVDVLLRPKQMRDFEGKWQWLQDLNLYCASQEDTGKSVLQNLHAKALPGLESQRREVCMFVSCTPRMTCMQS